MSVPTRASVPGRADCALCQASGREVTITRQPGDTVKERSKVRARYSLTPISSRESMMANTRAPGLRTERRTRSSVGDGNAAVARVSVLSPCCLAQSDQVVRIGISTDPGSMRGSRSWVIAVSAASRAHRWASHVFPEPGPPSTVSSQVPSSASLTVERLGDGSLVSSCRVRSSSDGALPCVHGEKSHSLIFVSRWLISSVRSAVPATALWSSSMRAMMACLVAWSVAKGRPPSDFSDAHSA